MNGNLREWTNSLYSESYGSNDEQSNQGNALRVLRGGAFYTGTDDLRAAYRGLINPDVIDHAYGFRCVRPDLG